MQTKEQSDTRRSTLARGAAAPAHIAMIGNFPPRRCGIATFTEDNYLALRAVAPDMRIDVYAMDDGQVGDYPGAVTQLIAQDDVRGYQRAAERINASGASLLWLHHEFGIFGGDAGGHILELLDRLTIPYAVMLHTVLEKPDTAQRAVMQRLIRGASALVVMAEKGREILDRVYGVPRDAVALIPHGVPDRPLLDTAGPKEKLGFAGRSVILTFGLLSPDKGIGDMIAAMPAIRERCPDALYVVLGQTHPNVLRHEGEALRERLLAQADALGVGEAVAFINRYTTLDDLVDYLAAADVYVTPYHNPAQITSGTLSYAVALGKPVVATPYVHARELLADGHGRIVPFRDSAALAREVGDLLADKEARLALAARAYARGRTMTWDRFGEALLGVFAGIEPRAADGVIRAPRPSPTALPITAIERLTDDVGILQHSAFSIADRNHGYCIDDNARALMLVTMADDMDRETRSRLTHVYASFVNHAWNEAGGCYRNFMGYDRQWLEEEGSEDSNGRTLWTLGLVARDHPDAAVRRWGSRLFDRSIPCLRQVGSPRAQAFAILGAVAMLGAHPGHADSRQLVTGLGAELMTVLARTRRPDWAWFEAVLAYDNTRLSEALIRAGLAMDRPDHVATGLETLRWIADLHRTPQGRFRPVGTASFGIDYARPAAFDQQPVEAWAMIDACAAAWAATGDQRWQAEAERAYRWFLGDNDLGLPLISPADGECYDGLTPTGVNLNSGAESVLAWQIAHRAFRRLAADRPLQRHAESA